MHHLNRELLAERTKVKALSEELENPLNVHRWVRWGARGLPLSCGGGAMWGATVLDGRAQAAGTCAFLLGGAAC